MNDVQCLSHTKWECKFHIVWIPKCRRKMLYGQLRKNLGDVLHDLARQKESRVLEGHLQPDHVHMLISIPPKYAVWIWSLYTSNPHQMTRSRKRRLHVVRMYIRDQEQEDQRLEQLHLFKSSTIERWSENL